MFHFRILRDRRIMAAVAAVEPQGYDFLDILGVIFANLPEILLAINDPAALVALILKLLGAGQQPVPQ